MQYITYAASLHLLCITLLLCDITNIKKSHMKFFIACVIPVCVGGKSLEDSVRGESESLAKPNHYVFK